MGVPGARCQRGEEQEGTVQEDTLGLRHLLELPVRCEADGSVSGELRDEVWPEV